MAGIMILNPPNFVANEPNSKMFDVFESSDLLYIFSTLVLCSDVDIELAFGAAGRPRPLLVI